MAGLGTGAGTPIVNVYHEKSRILPDVARVLACLYEKDVKFETIKASYKDLLSLQASWGVPVPFYDGPVFLQDSREICHYIAETYEHQGYPFLLGKDVLERASIEQWLRNEEHAFDPPSRALFCHLAFPPQYEDEDAHEAINQETRKLEEVLEVYDQRLGETEYLAGNKFTLADLVHLPGTHHVITSDRFAYLYDSRRNVQRWWNSISARDSWQQVLRDMKNVEEQHELERQKELEEKQKQQWLAAPSPRTGVRDIRIDPRKQEGTKPETVVVVPPSIGAVSSSVSPAPQDHGPTSDQKPSSPDKTKQGGFFAPTEKSPPTSTQTGTSTQKSPSSDSGSKSTFFTPPSTPRTAKAHQSTNAENARHKDTNGTKSTFFTPSSTPSSAKTLEQSHDDKPTSKTDSSPRKPSQRSPAEAPDQAGTLAKLSSQDSSKISQDREPDSSKTEKKPTDFSPQAEKPVRSTYTTPDTQTPQTPFAKPSKQRGSDTSFGPEPSQKLKSDEPTASTPSKGDRPDVIVDEDRFTTKRLRGLFNPDVEDSEYPSKQEEAPADPNKHSDMHGREKKPTMIPDSGKSVSSESTNKHAPYAPVTDEGRSAIQPQKGGTATGGAEKSSLNQEVPPGGPGTDKLPKTVGVNAGAPQDSAPKTTADPSTIITSDEQPKKLSIKGEIALETTPRKILPTDSHSTSATVEEVTPDAHVKEGPTGRGGILDVQDIGAGDTTKKTIVDKRTEELSSQQTSEPIREVGPTLQGITSDESTKAAPTGPVEKQALGEQNKRTVPDGGTPDSNGKAKVKTSPDDPRGTPLTTQGIAPTPAIQLSVASDKVSAQSHVRNEVTETAETSRTSTAAPNEKPGGQVPRNAGESSSGSSPMKSKEYVNEQDDQSGAKIVDKRMRQGDDVAENAKTGKHNKDYIANANGSKNRKSQEATIDAPSKLQMQSGKEKSETSKEGDMKINDTANSRSLETSREVQPSSPEKTTGQQQIQEIRYNTSMQDNVKKSTDAPPLQSEIEQQNKYDSPTEEDRNNREKTSSDTQQDKK